MLFRKRAVVSSGDIIIIITPPFLFQWFLANLSYQEALSDTQVAIVNILSSTSGDSLSLSLSVKTRLLLLST